MKNKLLYLLFIGSFFWNACAQMVSETTSDLDIEFAEQAPKLVISAYLNPDSAVSATIHHTVTLDRSYDSTYYRTDGTAWVAIYEDNILADTLAHVSEGVYRAKNGFKPTALKQYVIKAWNIGFDTAYSLPVTIPPKIAFTYTYTDSIGVYNSSDEFGPPAFGQKVALMSVYISDVKNEKNYYAWSADILTDGNEDITTFNPVGFMETWAECEPYANIETDRCFDGSDLLWSYQMFAADPDIDIHDYKIKFYFGQTSALMYQIAKDRRIYMRLENEPFFEPFNISSNIVNGYGAVLALNMSEIEINL